MRHPDRLRLSWLPQRGLTLAEVMVTVVIIAIMAAVAIPTFSSVFHNNRLSDFSNSFVSSSQLARGEALKANVTVTLCASSSGVACAEASSGWQVGWIVFRDVNGNREVDTGDVIIQVQKALSTDYRMSSSAGNSLVFQPTGVGTTTSTLILCKATPAVDSDQRQILLSPTGRVFVSKISANACS